jgi:hypothetical protein
MVINIADLFSKALDGVGSLSTAHIVSTAMPAFLSDCQWVIFKQAEAKSELTNNINI